MFWVGTVKNICLSFPREGPEKKTSWLLFEGKILKKIIAYENTCSIICTQVLYVSGMKQPMFESYQGDTDIYYLAGLAYGDQQLAKLENN